MVQICRRHLPRHTFCWNKKPSRFDWSSLKYDSDCPTDYKAAMVQLMACRLFGAVVDTKLTLSDPSRSLADSSSSGESVRLPLGQICFVYFSFSFAVYVICFVWVLMPACLSLLSIVWNKCARHAGSGQCFRPALFWRQHTRLESNFWVVTACGRSYFSIGLCRLQVQRHWRNQWWLGSVTCHQASVC